MASKPNKDGLIEGRDDDFGLFLEAQAKKKAKIKKPAPKTTKGKKK